MDFYEKFFGYFADGQGQFFPYSDNLGQGEYSDWRHWVWIIAAPMLGVFVYKYFRKNPQKARSTLVVLAVILFVFRVGHQSIKVLYGDETPMGRMIPFHMCAVIGVVVPIVVIFNIKSLKMPVYTLSLMGGIATVAFGEYFTSHFLTFYFFEGIISHTILILIPLIEVGARTFRFDIKKSWSVPLAMVILIGWATLANKVFFSGYNTNYMYLDESGLPDGLGGDLYFLIYVALFILVYLAIFLPPWLYSKRSVAGHGGGDKKLSA